LKRHLYLEHGMRGQLRAPQYGIPRVLAVREVKVKRKITQGELVELAKLMQGAKG
jgi:hypothetical protein